MHRIRLREPWTRVAALTPGGWAFQRKFNRPTGIDPTQRVLLQFTPLQASPATAPRVHLNDQAIALAADDAGVGWISHPITDQLALHNRLVLAVDPSPHRLSDRSAPTQPERLSDVWDVV
ncbi:MAG: hypothetical protein D6753_12690, partial [Planctomycetota bacterium]